MKRVIHKVAIANRSEIAVRLLTACREMDIESVLLHSSADENSKAVRMSEDCISIGAPEPKDSYLNIQAIIDGALSVGADALHPGYGFLSENPELAKACGDAGITFIGPSVECLELFGNKILARKKAVQCGLPVLPAYELNTSFNNSMEKAKEAGFPVIVKSTQGGGGRGLRVVFSEDQLKEALSAAQRETQTAFGSSQIYIEKYLSSAKHIEVQVFGDSSGRIHYLFDRDCSLQRKHQKIIEEAPAISLSPALRKEIQEAATCLIQSVDYQQAGTVEFLVQDGKFYFMEVNPRLQVECPVTEMILGVDLVKAQLRSIQGQVPFLQKNFTPRGHSIQCRIYAENAQKQVPVFGKLGECFFPHGVNSRFDMGFESGDEIPGFYDSMIGKIIVWEENRIQALKKMNHTLQRTVIFGLQTNISFLQDLLMSASVIDGTANTIYVENGFLKNWKEKKPLSLNSDILSTIREFFSSPSDLTHSLASPVRSSFNPWKFFYEKNNHSKK